MLDQIRPHGLVWFVVTNGEVKNPLSLLISLNGEHKPFVNRVQTI